MDKLRRAIYGLEDLNVIKDLAGKFNRTLLEQQDVYGFDVLHHAIVVNYGEVVRLFLLKYNFSSNPKTWIKSPYLHLSCLLGHTTVVNILLEHRPGDYYEKLSRDELPDWTKLKTVVDEEIENLEHIEHLSKIKSVFFAALNGLKQTLQDNFLPLDIAAIAGHSNVIKLLLSCKHTGFALTSIIEGAVKLNAPRALKVLLCSEKQCQRDIDEAFKAAVRRKEADCMKVLLAYGVNDNEIFHGLNAFHVMYMYSSAYRAPNTHLKNAGLDECTTVLIESGKDINAKLPLGAYPLYSIIHAFVQEKDQDPAIVPKYHLAAFKALLEAGADPNFDEVHYFANLPEDTSKAIGRDIVTSGLNALFSFLQASDTWRAIMDVHLDECCSLLLKHGAHSSYIDSYGETPFHDLMKLWAMQHAMGHMHVDLSNMMILLLSYGADPNLQSTNGLYPVHYYFKILFNLMGGFFAYERWRAFDKSKKVLHLLMFMNTNDAIIAYRQIKLACLEAKAKDPGVPTDVLHHIRCNSRDILLKPKSLQLCCQLKIWEAVGRKQSHVDGLPLPPRHIHDLKHIFSLHSQ